MHAHRRPFIALVAFLFCAAPVAAQEVQTEAPAKGDTAAQQQSWATQCVGVSRSSPLNCTMEQRVILRDTGRLVARISIQIGAGESRQPGLLLHVPLNLSVGAGITLQIDETEPLKFPIQTCDSNGCYAGSPLQDELIAGLKRGKALKMGFQGLDQKPVAIPFVLAGFTNSFDLIK
jgi:invasion protein IalB